MSNKKMSHRDLLSERLSMLDITMNTIKTEFESLREDIKALPEGEETQIDFKNPMSWVKTFDDICKCEGGNEILFLENCKQDHCTEDEIAYRQLKLIRKIITNDHRPPADHANEKKWHPYFDLGAPSGFGFSNADFTYWNTCTAVAAHLYFRTENEADFAGRTFLKIYEKFIKP